MTGASYTPFPGARVFILVFFTLMMGFGVFVVIAVAQGDPKSTPLPFLLLWLAALLWNGYWWLWRISTRLEVRDDRVRWMTPLRSGEIDLAEVTAIRPMRFMSQVSVLAVRNQRNIAVFTVNGFSDFADYLAKGRSITVSSNVMQRLGRGLRSGSAFKLEA